MISGGIQSEQWMGKYFLRQGKLCEKVFRSNVFFGIRSFSENREELANSRFYDNRFRLKKFLKCN